MNSSTAKRTYLGSVTRNAQLFNQLVTFLNKEGIDIHDPYLDFGLEHLRRRWIQLRSDINIKGFKYRLEVLCPRNSK